MVVERVRIDKYVAHIDQHTLAQEVEEHSVHDCLKCAGCAFETEWHDAPLILTHEREKGRLMTALWCHANLVKALFHVLSGKPLTTL